MPSILFPVLELLWTLVHIPGTTISVCKGRVAGATTASTVHKPPVQVTANFQGITFPPPSSGRLKHILSLTQFFF